MALFVFTATTATGSLVGEIVAHDMAEARILAQAEVGAFPVRRIFEAPPKRGDMPCEVPRVPPSGWSRRRRSCPWIDDKPQRRSPSAKDA